MKWSDAHAETLLILYFPESNLIVLIYFHFYFRPHKALIKSTKTFCQAIFICECLIHL